jgi:LPXTG-motif cell wall-anchored protein
MRISINHARIAIAATAVAASLSAAAASAATIDVPTSFYETGELNCSYLNYTDPQSNFVNQKEHTYNLWISDPGLAQSIYDRCDAAEHPQPAAAQAPAVLASETQLPTVLPKTGSSMPILAIATLLAAIGTTTITLRRSRFSR